MDTPRAAFNFLSTRDAADAQMHLAHLEKLNNKRRRVVAAMTKEANQRVGDSPVDEVICVGDAAWMPGVVGLLAHRLVERFNRPVCVWGKAGSDVIRGSARSDGSVNIVELMAELPDGMLKDFGGHEHSGGFALDDNSVESFAGHLNEAYRKVRRQNTAPQPFLLDTVLSLDALTWSLYEAVASLAPFGLGNTEPLFFLPDIQIANVVFFGKEKNHTRLVFKKANGETVSAIAFAFEGALPQRLLRTGNHIDLAATLEKNVWRGASELRLRIKAIKSAL